MKNDLKGKQERTGVGLAIKEPPCPENVENTVWPGGVVRLEVTENTADHPRCIQLVIGHTSVFEDYRI